jgi:serine/threonine protein kinase
VREPEFAGILPGVTSDPPGETMAEVGRDERPPESGEKIGKYRLDRVIGAGGMGIVWAAFDPDLERAVAIKVLRAGGGEATLRTRLLREARAMARLKHPNVLTVYEVGTDRGRDYIAMELVDGESLDIWLAKRPPQGEVMAALLAAGQGLAAAHEAGLVHRDFKPHNVLRSRSGHVYVTDFGLARGSLEEGIEIEHLPVSALPDRGAPRRPLDSLLDSPLTQTGVLIGTPAYMAPEQFAGHAPDARSDQFAYCVTAWEALTGVRPFGGTTLAELESAAARGPRDLEAPEVPASLRAVLARGLDPSPAARWSDLPSLLRALSDASAGAASPSHRRRRIWIATGLVVAGSVAASILLTVLSRSSSGDDCGSPQVSFERAWSPRRKAQLLAARPGGDSIGAVLLLDKARQSWLDTYRAACKAPPGDERQAQLDCLRLVRDTVQDLVDEAVAPGSKLVMKDVLVRAATLESCDPDHDDEFPRASDFPFTPTPPVGPTPPLPPSAPPAP